MFDIDIKNVKKGRTIWYIFFIIGILLFLVLGGIYLYNIIKINKLDSKVLSTKVEIKSHIDDEGSTMYTPIYYYEVNGNEYSCSTNLYTNHNPGTKNRTVYYDSKEPSNCITEYSKSTNNIILIFLIIPIIFILVAGINIRKVNKRVKAILKLNQSGKLVKNLPYRLENTNVSINGKTIKRPVVDYKLSSGTIVSLDGDARFDNKLFDADGMVDLLIDEDDPNNYFIDFEINRLSGNLPEDYYQKEEDKIKKD